MMRFAPAAAATGVLVGAAIVATRFVIADVGPASLALLRYAIGVCCLAPALLFSPRVRFERRDVLPIAMLGIAQFGILIALLNYALGYITAARAALIFATMPLLTMILAAALGYERLTLTKAAGVLLTIVGVGFALGEKTAGVGTAPSAWIGELVALASALCGALCSVLYRPYLRRYPTLQVGAFAMLASVGFLAVLAAGEGFFSSPPRFGSAGALAIAFIGVSSAVGYYLWLWALNHTTPTRVTVFLALSPITAAALGQLLLGEAMSAPVLSGLVCVSAGLWLAHKPDRVLDSTQGQ
jgi:drug/metabolite transporter (DMT)-like permease